MPPKNVIFDHMYQMEEMWYFCNDSTLLRLACTRHINLTFLVIMTTFHKNVISQTCVQIFVINSIFLGESWPWNEIDVLKKSFNFIFFKNECHMSTLRSRLVKKFFREKLTSYLFVAIYTFLQYSIFFSAIFPFWTLEKASFNFYFQVSKLLFYEFSKVNNGFWSYCQACFKYSFYYWHPRGHPWRKSHICPKTSHRRKEKENMVFSSTNPLFHFK